MSRRAGQVSYYRLLASKIGIPIILVLSIAVLYVISMSYIEHRISIFPYAVLTLALVKTVVISIATMKQLSKLISICHSLDQLVWTFGSLIVITLFSFASDFTCLYQSDPTHFDGVKDASQSYIFNLYQFFYFSVATFSTLGYGDIVPVSGIARFVVILEVFMSFIIIIFALSNIKKIHTYE